MSTFSTLSTALRSLYAQRQGLDVTGQNIANANTEGYTRQRVNMQSIGAPAGPTLFSTWEGAGSGVTVTGVSRLQDSFLEARARTEHASSSYLLAQQEIHARVEEVFNEPSEAGLQAQMSDLWTAFSDVSNRPSDLPARSQLLQRASTLADSLNSAHDSVSKLWSANREHLDAVVREVNTLASSIGQLNQGIVQAKQSGLSANELSDQRDQMLLKLSELTGATARVRDDGAADAYIGGSALVSGSTFRQLTTDGAHRIDDQSNEPVTLLWADNSTPVATTSGTAAAVMETLAVTLPNVTASLDTVARTLAETVNNQHAAGVDLNGTAGEEMFSGTTAATIKLNFTDPKLVAAAAAGAGALDGSNAAELAGMVNLLDGPDETYRAIVVQFGVQTQAVNRRTEIQSGVKLDVDSARSSQSGVNLDEEMASLLAYQRAYEAASRVVSTVDSMLDTLINRMGA